jgi:hypothetical protein
LYLGIDASLNIYNHTEYYPTGLALVGGGISIAFIEALYHYTVQLTVIEGHKIAKIVERCLVEEIEGLIVHVDPANEENKFE